MKRALQQLIQDKYGGNAKAVSSKDKSRLERGEPVDYIIGWKPFLGCRIDLLEHPLIPRQETEYWVERWIQYVRSYHETEKFRVLDLCAGSGCIGIAVLKHFPNVHVDFVDSEGACVRQIEKNLEINGIAPRRARVVREDMFAGARGTYDYILSNPPYLHDASKVQDAVLEYEPHNALFSGGGGLDHVRTIVSHAPRYLVRGGSVWFEFDDPEQYAIEQNLEASLYSSHEFFRDQFGKYRYAVATK